MKTREQAPETSPVAERVTLALSIGILALIVGLVVYQYVVQGTQPPVIEVTPQLEAVRQEPGGYYLPVVISNRGDETAEEVVVQLTLRTGQLQEEGADITVQFLPGGAVQKGTVVFQRDPRRGKIEVAVSYLTP